MVGNAHPRLMSSVVVTLVQVMHNDTSWPASRLRMNLFVQMLANRAQRVWKNTEGESNRTFGLGVSEFKDRVVGSPESSVNFDETGEGDCCIVVAGVTLAVWFLRTLDECCQAVVRLLIEKICVNLSLSADQTTRA